MKALVVFYSRTGVTKRAANAMADECRAAGMDTAVEEIIDKRNRRGVINWFRAGRDAMRRRLTEIEAPKLRPGDFDAVAIGTPVWGWNMTPAVRTYLQEKGGGIRKAAFFCTMGGSGAQKTFAEMEKIIGRHPAASLALLTEDVRKNAPEGFTSRVKQFVTVFLREGHEDGGKKTGGQA